MKVYLVAGKRTPFGKFGGSFSNITPVDLAVHAATGILKETNLNPALIDHVVMGNVITSSTDTMYGARHLALKIGCDVTTPGYVVNRLCGSGIQIMMDAKNMIELGQANCVLVAGTENMSMAPHLTYGARFGTKYGSLQVVDMLLDALTDKYTQTPMGITAENLAKEYTITREESDAFAYASHAKATKAYNENLFDSEIVGIEIKNNLITRDEHLRSETTMAELQKLRPAFSKDGVVTPASASGVVDGACAVLIANEEFCKKNNLTPLAEIIDGSVIGVDPTIMGIGPVPAIKNLLEKNKMSLSQIDFIEINEAFAPQTLSCMKALEIDPAKLNVWGGAVALGHPLAASGTRIALTVARQLQHYKKEYAIASACIGGGQGIALLLKRV